MVTHKSVDDREYDRPPRLETAWRERLKQHGIKDAAVRDDIVSDLLTNPQLLSDLISPEEFETIASEQIKAIDFSAYRLSEATTVKNAIEDVPTLRRDLISDVKRCRDEELRGPAAAAPEIGADVTPPPEPGEDTDSTVTGAPQATLSFATTYDPETDENGTTDDPPTSPGVKPDDAGVHVLLEQSEDAEFDPMQVAEIKEQLRPLIEREQRPISVADLIQAVRELERETDFADTSKS